jgi:hypothetical protein
MQQHGRAAPGCDEKSNKSVGHEVSDDVVWGKVEILRQNPVNLYSFVGLISSNQQVIRNSINTTMFSAKKTKQTKH